MNLPKDDLPDATPAWSTDADDVLIALGTGQDGLAPEEAGARLGCLTSAPVGQI